MNTEPQLHIAVFPWLAFGHMMPLLELSKSLAKRGHQISYISTPRNLSRLPKLPPNLSPLIHLIPLPLPKVSGLPDNAEATSDVPPEKVQFLKLALDGLQQPFANFLKDKKPDWIILDFASHWAPSVASQFSIPCIFFSVFTASALTFLGPENELTPDGSRTTPEHFTVPPYWIPFPSNLAYSLYGATLLLNNSYRLNASCMPDVCRFASTLRACKLVAPRSCMELESEWLHLLQHLYNKPVIPVGLLQPSSSSSSSNSKTSDVKNDAIIQWLDKQEPKSVVYIAFGSEATLSIELLHELALGLEMSELHFLWALKKRAEFDEGEVLPEGFAERNRERGVVTFAWVPQLDVLRHVSVGAFLTHSGWSSVIEALQFGHPLVLLPIFADQDLNARMVEHRGFGVEVKRKEDGSFDKEAVASALRLVMLDDDDDDDEGMMVRVKAKELSVIFADKGRQERYVDDFIKHLRDHRD